MILNEIISLMKHFIYFLNHEYVTNFSGRDSMLSDLLDTLSRSKNDVRNFK